MVDIVNTTNTTGAPVHAFVVGVSRYPHLEDGSSPSQAGALSGLGQLTSAARSASEFAAWLLNERYDPDAELASLYVSLAPSNGETIHPDIATKLPSGHGATRNEVMRDWLDFRRRCRETRNATAFVYVAGHGVQQTSESSVLLLEDFAGDQQESELWAALNMSGLHASLNGQAEAHLQFWFVDACREEPEVATHFAALAGAYAGDQPLGRAKASPLFLAAGPRKQAFANKFGSSLFCEALLAALRRDAATSGKRGNDKWRVTTASLAEYICPRVLRESGSHRQIVELTGHVGTTAETIHVFRHTPRAKLTVRLNPPSAEVGSSAQLSQDDVTILSTSSWPLESELDAGLYNLEIIPSQQFKRRSTIISVRPPASEEQVTVQ